MQADAGCMRQRMVQVRSSDELRRIGAIARLAAADQRGFDLQIDDRVDRGGAADAVSAELRQRDVADVAGLHQVGDRADGVLDRHLRIEARRPVDVDVAAPEPGQAVADRVLDRDRAGVEAEPGAIGAAQRAELDAEQRAVAPIGDRLADQQLVLAGAVEVAGVEDIDAVVERGVDGRDALGLAAVAP